MFIVKYDFCHDDGTREYGIEEQYTSYDDARNCLEDCKEDEGCCNIQLIELPDELPEFEPIITSNGKPIFGISNVEFSR